MTVINKPADYKEGEFALFTLLKEFGYPPSCNGGVVVEILDNEIEAFCMIRMPKGFDATLFAKFAPEDFGDIHPDGTATILRCTDNLIRTK